MFNSITQAPSKGRLFASSGQLLPCKNAISVLLDLSYTLFFFFFKEELEIRMCRLSFLVLQTLYGT